MQLKSLWIKDYKNLKNFEINFEKGNGLSILIGNNGSGKSNLLEAISGIFADWYGTPSGIFGTDYRIEYDLDGKNIILEQTDCKRYVNGVFFKDSTINSYLPSNIIALYSGEDSRLFKNFYLTRYNSYLKDVFENGCIGKMGLYYVNKDLWNISLLTLILFMNDFQDVKDFLNTELGIKNDRSIEHINILMDWEDKNYNKTGNMALKAFIDKITPDGRRLRNPYFAEYLRELISNSSDNFEADPREVFNLFMHASIPEEFQIITGIEIAFNNGQTLESLSEGEKKLILIKAILKFVADEKSLLLLDEPDANIHEARKRKLYNLLKETPNRDVVMTTHSPIIAKIASENELIYLESKNGTVSEISTDKLNLVKKLASDEWNIMEAGIFLNSEKPLVLFEGKTDIDFVRRAIELLKEDEPKYEKIDVDFLCFNGTGNAKSFVENVRECVPNKKIILFFDRDSAGQSAMADISGKDKKSTEIENYKDYISDDGLLKAIFYPFSPEVDSGDFLLEDYFHESKIQSIIDQLLRVKKHPVKNLSNLSKGVKTTLAKQYKNYTKVDFEGFKPLLNKLLELLEIS